MTTIKEWQDEAHALSKAKGWWDEMTEEERDAAKKLAGIALMHLGLSAQLEAVRKRGSPPPMLTHHAIVMEVESLSPLRIQQLSKLSLIHSEVSEAVGCVVEGDYDDRTSASGKPEGLGAEVADIAIRCFDFCGGYGVDLEHNIVRKHEYNKTRPRRHGGKLA
jgi:hypothetical protein